MLWERDGLMYEVTPLVYLAERPTQVQIRPAGAHTAFEEGANYRVCIMPLEQTLSPKTAEDYPSVDVEANNGALTFNWTFKGEQEYYLRVFKWPNLSNKERLCNLRVYSLLPDLFARRPYRGDFHAHSCYSDGKESPAIVGANYRKAGYDILSLTDHHRYEPSVELIEAYKNVPIDITLLLGEEVHAPDNPHHVVNAGGNFSLNKFFREHPEEYRAEVSAIEAGLQVPEGVNKHVAAAFIWAFNKIRESGGLAVFPHPHWVDSVYHVADAMSYYLFRTKAFDAFEIVGGQDPYENNVQVALYGEMRAEGITCPIVGSSDSHGTEMPSSFKQESTILFTLGQTMPEIRDAIIGGYSVAVDTYPGETPCVHGTYRMVKYALFLMQTYFVQHDQLCIEEGLQMKAYAQGEPSAKAALEALHGRVAKLLKKSFGE